MASKIKQYKASLKQRGVAAHVIMAIDVDGRRGIISDDGQNVAFCATFDEAWKQYYSKELRLAREQAGEKIKESAAAKQ